MSSMGTAHPAWHTEGTGETMYYATAALNCVQARRAIRIYRKILSADSNKKTYDDVCVCIRANESKLRYAYWRCMGEVHWHRKMLYEPLIP